MEAQFGFVAPSGATARLAVVLGLAREGNPVVEALLNALAATGDDDRQLVVTPERMGQLLDPASGFCTWMGSLTTPPCTEGVRWFAQAAVLGVTRAQVAAFAAARGGDYGNARPVQPAGNATAVMGCYGPPPPTPPPTPTPTAAPVASGGAGANAESGDGEDDGNSLCFPAASTVVTRGGAVVALGDLPTGAEVAVAVAAAAGGAPSRTVSPVFMWSHRQAGGTHTFVRLSTGAHGALTLSPGHLVYVGGVPVPAAAVRVGDVLSAAVPAAPSACIAGGGRAAAATTNGCAASRAWAPAPVTAVERVVGIGLYHPHTLAGEPIVDGFHVSALTTAVGGGAAATAALSLAGRLWAVSGWAWAGLHGGEGVRGAGARLLSALG
ncbi:hypothetical protein BU14_1457s0001 [Porphyra umbilicalis]|uniref:Alpha-carbonic anhydrase domain-containing protein n=1 Tax=Porphyra umbilicalis TaxID=2786 RepID=A0A1X6NLN4_PORUM|nr:hypothetical protein BU14_1457s0001 [Porphyra umbilicalis]|eukprot:OSX69497.1 hypothetical protein BU14_1457s0001 [Porphyra umbilicalis]